MSSLSGKLWAPHKNYKKSKQFKTSLVMQKEVYSTKTDLASQCKFNEVELYILIFSDVLSGLRIPCCQLFPMGNFARLGWLWDGILGSERINHWFTSDLATC